MVKFYITLVINKVNGHGLSNTAAHHNRLAKKTKPTIERKALTTNKTECFSCNGEWVNTTVDVMH